tara:strand:+ start:445 stop:732 length:288 start_codon:yes stop_codon:yes gene_type:complete
MKSNIQKVYSKLPKIELEKVELATQKQVFAATDKLIAAQRDIDKGRAKLEKSYPQALKIISEIEAQAKELGINADDIKGFKSLNIEAKNTKSQYL